MSPAPQLLLVGAVAAVGVLHTIVPDHWVPITLIARQQRWTSTETGRAALKAGTGHVLSTLMIALIVWVAGVAFAQRFGQYVDAAASLALIGFGGWIAVASFLELRGSDDHGHAHSPPVASARQASSRTALLFILGSSPMVEGIPAFFAAAKYGAALIAVMSAVFAFATVATYVILCVYSTAGLHRICLGPLERYGEVLSGVFIAAVGAVFWAWPVL